MSGKLGGADILVDATLSCQHHRVMNLKNGLGRNFGLSVLVGAYAGVILNMLIAMASDGFPWQDLWSVPIIIFFYGLISAPFVAIGLAIFGIPAAHLLDRFSGRWWVGCVAILLGGLAGKILFFAVDHAIFFGYYDIRKIELRDFGILYGAPSGFAWWAFNRRSAL